MRMICYKCVVDNYMICMKWTFTIHNSKYKAEEMLHSCKFKSNCRGWRRCLKVILQACELKNFRSCWWGGRAEGLACADPGASNPIGWNIPPFLVHQSRYHLATRSKADYNFNLDKCSQVHPKSKHPNLFSLYFPAVLKYLINIWNGMNCTTYPLPRLKE